MRVAWLRQPSDQRARGQNAAAGKSKRNAGEKRRGSGRKGRRGVALTREHVGNGAAAAGRDGLRQRGRERLGLRAALAERVGDGLAGGGGLLRVGVGLGQRLAKRLFCCVLFVVVCVCVGG